jgi:AcrR family transcriptional regulator
MLRGVAEALVGGKGSKMPEKAAEIGDNALSSPGRLIQAVLDAWASHGHAGISTRSLAQAAGLPVSSLYHHFGSLEQLFASAQAYARAAAEQWCAVRIGEIGAATLPAEALPGLLATLIDDWSHGQRRLALAWRECYMLAIRDDRYLPAIEAWRAMWSGFCQEICTRCGLGEFGELTSLVLDGESLLHLAQWRRTVDRACLDEMCRAWGCWLGGSLSAEGPWRRFAREEALCSMPPLAIRGGVPERIAAAAADIVERRGMAGLTHRAVAAGASLTLGVVSYNFRTSADLARVAFEMIYRRVVSGATPMVEGADRDGEAVTGYRAVPIQIAALDELLLAVVRDAELRLFVPQLRYLRGRSSGPLLQALLGMAELPSPIDAALFSCIQSGLKRACVGKTAEEVQVYTGEMQDLLLKTLGKV